MPNGSDHPKQTTEIPVTTKSADSTVPDEDKALPKEKTIEKLFPGQFISLDIIRKIINGNEKTASMIIDDFDFDTGTPPERNNKNKAIAIDFSDKESSGDENQEDDSFIGFSYGEDPEPPPPWQEMDSQPPSIIPRNSNRPPDKHDLQSLAIFLGNKKKEK